VTAWLRLWSRLVALLEERRHSRTALRRLNSELEECVAERTRQLQAALDESSRLAAVLEATPDIVGVASLDGQGLYLNRAGRLRLGVALDERADRHHISEFYTERSFETVMHEGIPVAMREGSWSGEVVMRSLAGEEIPVSMAGIVHFDAEGGPKYISAIARDITESKRMAAELQAAKEGAEAASRSKSTFLATMSHEIRTPMNAVIGMTDLLLSTELSTRQREFVSTIRAGGDALLTVINDILDFSKIEAGRLELERRPFDLRLALESTVDLLAPRASEKGLELALSVDPALPGAVVGDEVRLRQILVNLAGNGIKFTESGEVVVAVTAGRVEPDAEEVELLFCVRDTGIGIAPQKRDRLFASFSQLDPSTTREYGGTGLGLAISRRLVELMGGRIWVESDGVPGRGSAFHFTARLGRALAEPRAAAGGVHPPLAGRRVLIVDDNATNRHILALQLQRWGMLAIEAAMPEDALRLLRGGDRFDLVLLDMQMPDMDGLSLARAICGQRTDAVLPIIMLTSVGRDVGPEAESIACVAGQLTKPVKSSHLYDAIAAALVGRGTAASDDRAETIRPVGDGTPRALARLEILLAEDLEVNRRFALLALEEIGYRADVAVNGADVLGALDRRPYDVILMDVQMPELDGLEAARRIRRHVPADRQPYIIAMTANAMRGDREMCLEAGMDDYLSKPVYLDELRAAIERAAERVAIRRAVSTSRTGDVAVSVARTGTGAHESGAGAVESRHPRGAALTDLFAREADDVFRRLCQAFERGDWRAVRDAAHGIKGSAGYVGAAGVVAASAGIERAARAGEAIEAPAVERLGEALASFRRGSHAEPDQLSIYDACNTDVDGRPLPAGAGRTRTP
jgi:PAS domain S-box-containing protein